MGDKTTRELLKDHRRNVRLRQYELAALIGVKPNYISGIETGAKQAGAKYLAKFAQALKLSKRDKAELLDSVLK